MLLVLPHQLCQPPKGRQGSKNLLPTKAPKLLVEATWRPSWTDSADHPGADFRSRHPFANRRPAIGGRIFKDFSMGGSNIQNGLAPTSRTAASCKVRQRIRWFGPSSPRPLAQAQPGPPETSLRARAAELVSHWRRTAAANSQTCLDWPRARSETGWNCSPKTSFQDGWLNSRIVRGASECSIV